MPQTKRQQDITLLLSSFEQYFPGVQTPEIKYLCAWLYRMPVEDILSIMDRVAATDAENPFNSPIAAIWTMIRNNHSASGETAHYDDDGRRL
ncbi:MAG: hypothetical protein JWN74_2429 [Acidobacteriaceae bacterium]|nr:hypothetical protein [Acidobacteriaceae bacterium]